MPLALRKDKKVHWLRLSFCSHQQLSLLQGPNSDTEELLKNEETADNGNVTTTTTKGKKKKKYLGRIQYKAIKWSVCVFSFTALLTMFLSGGI